jgi:hypothetical protein
MFPQVPTASSVTAQGVTTDPHSPISGTPAVDIIFPKPVLTHSQYAQRLQNALLQSTSDQSDQAQIVPSGVVSRQNVTPPDPEKTTTPIEQNINSSTTQRPERYVPRTVLCGRGKQTPCTATQHAGTKRYIDTHTTEARQVIHTTHTHKPYPHRSHVTAATQSSSILRGTDVLQKLVVPANDQTTYYTNTGPPRGAGNGDLNQFSEDDDDAVSLVGQHMEQAVKKVFRTITKHIK